MTDKSLAINEADIEVLETYLDGELPVTDAESMWRRLAVEPALALALEELRRLRTTRLAVWTGFEPAEEEVESTADRVLGSVHRRRMFERVNRGLRYIATAAACLFLGFRAGWIERGDGLVSVGQPAGNVAMSGELGGGGVDQNSGAYQVAVHDQAGRIVAVQRFASAQDAINFANEVNHPQARTHDFTPRDMGTNVVPASDEQF